MIAVVVNMYCYEVDDNLKHLFAFRHGVHLGLFSVEEVVSWAEALFEDNHIPDEWMIQLVIAQSSDDVVQAVDPILSYGSEEEVWTTLKTLLCKPLKNKTISSYGILQYAATYAPEGEISNDIFYLLLSFDDLEQGYGSLEEIDAEILKFLKK